MYAHVNTHTDIYNMQHHRHTKNYAHNMKAERELFVERMRTAEMGRSQERYPERRVNASQGQ